MSRQTYDQMLSVARSARADWQGALRAAAAADASVLASHSQVEQVRTIPVQVALRQAQLDQASAQVDQARADLSAAQLNLSFCHVIAPESGRIAEKDVNPGDNVAVGQVLARIVTGAPWITANFKETQITDIRPGQPALIRVDAYPGVVFHGYVDSIEPGTATHFSLLPAQNATGNFVKVVQRVPVKILFDNPNDVNSYLVLGMSAVPSIDTTAAEAAVPTRTEPFAAIDATGRTPDGNNPR
jgi:membrane fusion protein (multidrug efflux system)